MRFGALRTLSLNHPPSLKLWRVSDLESWLYGMTELRQVAMPDATGANEFASLVVY